MEGYATSVWWVVPFAVYPPCSRSTNCIEWGITHHMQGKG